MRAGICQTSPPTFRTGPSVYLSRESLVGSLPALVLVKLPSSVAPLSIFESAASSFAWRSGEFGCSAVFCSASTGDKKLAILAQTATSRNAIRLFVRRDMVSLLREGTSSENGSQCTPLAPREEMRLAERDAYTKTR